MNIFYLDNDINKCAEYHTDKHVVKMILEYAQLLSTAHRVIDGNLLTAYGEKGRKTEIWRLPDDRQTTLYKATHINHPSAIWARKSDSNYKWLYQMLASLCTEYTYRYSKVHSTERLLPLLSKVPSKIAVGVFTEPSVAMPEEYVVEGDSIQSYKNYYVKGKRHLHSWRGRGVPVWVSNL